MPWTAPRDWITGQVVTETDLDTHVRDNLRYLKGLDGAIDLNNQVTAPRLVASNAAANAISEFSFTAGTKTVNLGVGGPSAGGFANAFYVYDTTFGTVLFHNGGKWGFGTANPQGRIHAYGSTGGALFWDFDGLSSTQTILPAGSIQACLNVYGVCRSSGGTNQGVSPGMNPRGNSFSIFSANNFADIVTMFAASDGSLTINRTAGSQTYKLALWITYV